MSTASNDRPVVTRGRVIAALVIAVLVAVGVAILVGKLAGYARLVDEIRDAHPVWLAVCFGAQIVSYTGYVIALRMAILFGDGPRMSAWAGLRLVMASLGATRLVAAGGAGGLAVVYWALRQAGEDRQRSLVRVLGFNTMLYAVFAAAGFVAGGLVLAGADGAPTSMALTWVCLVGACTLAALVLVTPGRMERVTTVSPTAGWLRRGVGLAVAGVDMVRQMLARRTVALQGAGGSALWWAGDILCLWAGLKAFGVSIGAPSLVLAYVTGYAATLVPLPTGGVGGVDAAMTFALDAVGVPLADALLGVVAYRLFQFWLPTIPAVIALIGLPRLGRDLRRAADGDASATADVNA